MNKFDNRDDFIFISDGKEMFIVYKDQCQKIIDPQLIEVNTNKEIDELCLYDEHGNFNSNISSSSKVSVDISLSSSGTKEIDNFDIDNLFSKDVYKDYSVFDLFELINQKLKER